MLEYLKANPEVAAALIVTFGFPLWSGVMHGIGKRLDARGLTQIGAVFHWLATRTPPTSKAEAVTLAKAAALEAAGPETPRNSGEP